VEVINGRPYYLDENGRPRWEDNDRLVPPLTWELHVNRGREVEVKGREEPHVVGKSLEDSGGQEEKSSSGPAKSAEPNRLRRATWN
jgi:hypothetical protein